MRSFGGGPRPPGKTPGISAAAAWRQAAADAIPMPGRICQAALLEADAVDCVVVGLLLGGVLSLPASLVLGTFLSGVLDFSECSLGDLDVGAPEPFELLIAAIRVSNWIVAYWMQGFVNLRSPPSFRYVLQMGNEIYIYGCCFFVMHSIVCNMKHRNYNLHI